MLRVVVIMLAVLGGCAKPAPQHRTIRATFRACFDNAGRRIIDGPGKCNDKNAKIYSDAFAKGEPVVELVTMGIGALIWERHGHIALCIRDRNPENDICYNYGIGDFHEPLKMTWGFFRGTDSFWAGEQPIVDLIRIYAGADRTVWAQPLPMTMDQKQKVIAKLYADTAPLPEREGLRPPGTNLHYAYDHFWDNCTTRVRDILDDATNHALSSMTEPTDDRTYRDLAREGFYGMRVPLIITDIAMGRVTDRVPNYYERMFLPQFLREAVHKKWDIEPIVLYERQGDPPLASGPSGRVWFALIVLLVCAPAVLARWLGRFQRLGLAVAVVPYALLGAILWFLAIISPLGYVEWNESLVVFLPLDLALFFLSPVRRRLYAQGRVGMLVLIALLDLVGIFHQPLLAPILWPLIPNALVGFWKPEWTRAKPEPPAPPQKSSKSKKSKG